MKSTNRFTKISKPWYLFNKKGEVLLTVGLLMTIIWGCEETATSVFNEESDSNTETSELAVTLAEIKAATNKYQSVIEAVDSGYNLATSFVPNMGYHYIKSDLVSDGEINILEPEALVYMPILAYGEKTGDLYRGRELQLVALEYLMPGTGEEDDSDLPDLFPGEEDLWQYDSVNRLWTLHVWAWLPNPSGLFYQTNSRVGG